MMHADDVREKIARKETFHQKTKWVRTWRQIIKCAIRLKIIEFAIWREINFSGGDFIEIKCNQEDRGILVALDAKGFTVTKKMAWSFGDAYFQISWRVEDTEK